MSYKAQPTCPTYRLRHEPYIQSDYPGLEPAGIPKEHSMIQLATDPTASRMSYRPQRGEGAAKESTSEIRRGRTGHAWPFLSRYTPRPVREDTTRRAAGDSGS